MLHDFYVLIHFGCLCLAAIGILLADHMAFEWVRGVHERVGLKKMLALHLVVTLALAGLVGSGLLLFWPERVYFMGQPLFWLKMGFVFVLLINSFFIEYLMHHAVRGPYRHLPQKKKTALMISGAVSTTCWLGAGLTALVLFS